MKKNYRETGGYYEQQAAEYLRKQGLVILEQNYRSRMGELDLIARDGDYLVFVEVKYRKNQKAGSSLAAVGTAKQKMIAKMAGYYLLTHDAALDTACRFDVIGIDGDKLTWIQNAFEVPT